jgi:hypothetical protein
MGWKVRAHAEVSLFSEAHAAFYSFSTVDSSPGDEVDHSCPFSDEMNIAWGSSSTFPYVFIT